MYIVIEMQTDNGTTHVLHTEKNSREEAYSAFYTVCAAAAISAVEVHTAMLAMNDGTVLEVNCFEHEK